MSTDAHNTGHDAGAPLRHTNVSFEAQDVKPGTIVVYLIVLALAVVLSYAVCTFVLRATTRVAVQSDTPPPPVRMEMGKDYRMMPPEPRLQGVPGHGNDPQADLREKVRLDTEANEKAGWIDQDAGIAQIPVKDAMKVIAEKGLPRAPASADKNKVKP
jgi:hypothetical protein